MAAKKYSHIDRKVLSISSLPTGRQVCEFCVPHSGILRELRVKLLSIYNSVFY